MAQNVPSGVGFGAVVSSLFGGDAGKRPGAAHARVPGHGGFLRDLYWPVLVPALLLIAFGLTVVWSVSLTNSNASLPRQAVGAALGLAASAVIWRYDYRNLAGLSTWLLVLDVLLMVSPHIPGLAYNANGMTGWVRFGPGFQFQPSEVGKLVTIFLMASLCAQFNGKIKEFRDYAKLCGILLVPFVAIMTQPDLGTGLILLVIGASIIICAGARRDWVLVTIGLIFLGAALIVFCSMHFGFPLKQYQLNRLLVFVDPTADAKSGYQLQQSKIAVGSGGLLGKGIGAATQATGGFLPESHTDFVFATLAEEFGFVGSLVLLGLYGWLIFSTLRLAMRLESPFSKLVLCGIIAMWSYQLLQNVGMCIGIMPITGIPLPFISYGATSMVIQVASVGIVQSVYFHRPRSA